MKFRNIIIFILVMLGLSSCHSMRPYEMLRNSKDYEISEIETSKIEYEVQVNDRLDIRVLNNNGESYFGFGGDVTGGGVSYYNNRYNEEFVVEYDGKVKVPVLGRVDLGGLTIRQIEDTLETMYSEYFVDPFVLVKVNNRKVTVFMNGGSKINVVPMSNDQFTLIDAIAACGGLTEISRSYRIK